MAQIRPPEEVLYAFSQWLQHWADYALFQAYLFAASTGPGDPARGTDVAGSPPASQEHQSPTHWLELVQSGPPPHWLALFEEYGLEPPQGNAAQGDVRADIPLPESVPRPLQDLLGEFQCGLAQFAQQPDPIMPGPLPVESEAAAPTPAQFVHVKDPAADSASPSHTNGRPVPERPSDQDVTPGPSVTTQDADGLTPVQFSQVQGLTTGSILTSLSGDETGLERRQVRSGSQESGYDVKSAASAVSDADTLTPDPYPPQQKQARHATGSSPVKRVDGSQVTDPVPEEKDDPARVPARSRQQGGAETRPTPVRLRLNPKPMVAMPVPVLSLLPNVGESAQPASIQPSRTAPHPVPRLHVGVPVPTGQPLPAIPTPLIEPAGESHQDGAAPLLTPTAATDDTLSQVKSVEADILTETGLNSIHPLVRRGEDALLSSSSAIEHREIAPPQWSQPATPHWPELPECLPPIRPPSNVLADPDHRVRIDREQRGRTWTA